ncbi:MAG: hypothetical protein ABJB61_03440 [bacterium]
MSTFKEYRVVDNQTLLLGLDYMYRETMMRHESGELLVCARRLAAALEVNKPRVTGSAF